MIPPPPHRITSVYNPRRMSETGAGDSGLAARDVVAEVVRVTLLDDALRRDRREDLAACARARRLGFLAQAVSEVTPPEPRSRQPARPVFVRWRGTLSCGCGCRR